MDPMTPVELNAFAARLDAARSGCQVPCAVRESAESWVRLLLATLFPHFNHEETSGLDSRGKLVTVEIRLTSLLGVVGFSSKEAREIASTWVQKLPDLYESMVRDAQATDDHDPASENVDEVIAAYPGFYAVAVYRLAHELDLLGVKLLPRLLTEHAHRETGIEIHPGATIGVPFVIDHGTGIVIGQSATIGKNVKLYQGVTLGAISVKKSLATTKRHPTLEDDVVVYAGATILGGDTVIGARSVVGGNAWITKSVPPDSIAFHDTEVRARTIGANQTYQDHGAFI